MMILLIKILLIFMIVNLLMIISNIISKKILKTSKKTPLLIVDSTLKNQDVYLFPSTFPYCYHIF